MFTRLRENPWLRKRLDRWLDKRIPPATDVTLGHKSIFIMPTKAGWMYLAMLVLLLVTAINYQNSLIYGLAFWLFSMGLASMVFTYRNLSGLALQSGHVNPIFAGEIAELPLRKSTQNKRVHEALHIGFPENVSVMEDAGFDDSSAVPLSFRTWQRGWLKPGRLRVESQFPFGLFNAWTWVQLDFKGLVYPDPEYVPFVFSTGDVPDQIEGAPAQQSGQQDFHGLRSYQPGDSLKIIAWKKVAQGKGLVSKEFDHDEGASCWLDWDALAPAHAEIRLSRLTGWVLEAEKRHWRYGLKIPGIQISPDNTESHRDKCLRALALFNLNDEGQVG